jgi:pSer/pThr/pTyr-binding forkhead associated (FHA) protein
MLIEVTYPNSIIKTFRVEKSEFFIGRAKSCDVYLDIDGISRQHLKVYFQNDEIFIQDNNSTNGVFIGSEKLHRNVKTKYISVVPIRLGPILIQLKSDQEILNAAQDEKSIKLDLGNLNQKSENNRISPNAIKTKDPILKSQSEKYIVLGVILGVLYFGFEYFFLQNPKEEHSEDKPSVEKEIVPQFSSPQVIANLIPQEELLTLYNQKNCEGELQQYCFDLSLSAEGEGMIFKDQHLSLFTNLESLTDVKFSKTFEKLEKDQQYEILLAKLFFAPKNILKYKSIQAKVVQVNLVDPQNSDKTIIFSMALNLEDFYNIDDLTFHNIIDRVLILGSDGVYSEKLKNYFNTSAPLPHLP